MFKRRFPQEIPIWLKDPLQGEEPSHLPENLGPAIHFRTRKRCERRSGLAVTR